MSNSIKGFRPLNNIEDELYYLDALMDDAETEVVISKFERKRDSYEAYLAACKESWPEYDFGVYMECHVCHEKSPKHIAFDKAGEMYVASSCGGRGASYFQ